jgi:hypothetical protein
MKKILIIGFVLLGMLSCNDDILDLSPLDSVSDDAVWSDESLIVAYHSALYNGIPQGFNRHMHSKFCDECNSNGTSDLQEGTYTADDISSYSSNYNYMYYWTQGYSSIRKVNLFLENMETTTVEISDKEQLVAEAYFLRAFMYFELIRRFGGVPIVSETYDLTEIDDILFERNTFEECVEFIESDLEIAMEDLPDYISSTDGDFGRASQDACLALRSRLLLYTASPLFNEDNDLDKWQDASDAAFELIAKGNYSLYPDYGECFQTLSGEENSEIIFARLFTTSDYQQMPMINLGARWGAYGGWNASNGPSQNLVDDYDMISGEPAFLEDGSVNPYSEYDENDPYSNRDPRFEASIQHDGTVYRGVTLEMWMASDGESWGYDSYKQTSDNPRGGYVINKFMPEEDIDLNWQTYYTNPWIFFRLAEIYLNYAEAQFELGNEDVCREYINMVRARAGMPDIDETVTGDVLRTRLYNERRIELVFEGHRFFDVRRWDIADETESEAIYGMDIIKDVDTGEKTYEPVILLQRYWEDQMTLLPIETDEMDRNPNLTQTPGW